MNTNGTNLSLRKKSKAMKIGISDKILYIILAVLMSLLTIALIVGLLWALNTSLKSEKDYLRNILGLPNIDKSVRRNSFEQVTKLKNYTDIFKNFVLTFDGSYYRGNTLVSSQTTTGFMGMLVNTLLYAGVSGLICALVPCLTAYLCAKYNYALSSLVSAVYIAVMCIPIVGNYPTILSFLRNTGLYNTFWGIFLQKMSGGGMYFFVFFAFFQGQSNTYREAAELDGASEMSIMTKIYFPMAIKMIATVFLIQFVAHWNDYQTPLLYLPTHPTLSYGVYMIAIDPDILALRDAPHNIAACMMLALPILILFIIFKDKIMGNISLGGIKE